jgi:hypothetical protein
MSFSSVEVTPVLLTRDGTRVYTPALPGLRCSAREHRRFNEPMV